jgi:hypothetical protein
LEGVVSAEFTTDGFTIDLDAVFHAMWDHSEMQRDERVFNGGKKGVPAMKRLIADLFDVPVEDKMHPLNHAVRSQIRDRLNELGWATEDPGRSPRYALHREL